MTVRAPRFSYRHTLQEASAFVFSEDLADAFRSDTPGTRWLDGQAGILAGKVEDASNTVATLIRAKTDLSVSIEMVDLARWIVPEGHTFGNDRVFQLQFEDAFPITLWEAPTLSDGSVIEFFIPSSSLIDLEFATTDTHTLLAKAMRWTWHGSNSLDTGDIGELWWTNIYEPRWGPDFGWRDDTEGVFTDQEMRSGAIYTIVHGDERRTFTLQHPATSGTDLAVYDDLHRRTLYGAGTFWFDGVDTADRVQLLHAMDDTTDFAQTNLSTFTQIAAGAPDDGNCIQMVTDGLASDASIRLTVSDFVDPTLTDWRNVLLQLDFKLVGDSSWIADLLSLRFEVFSPGFASIIQFSLGQAIINSATSVAGGWLRIQLDTTRDYRTNWNTMDLTAPSVIDFVVSGAANAASRTVQFANFRLVDKAKDPVYVKIVPGSYRRQQASRAPGGAGGPRYDVEFEMIEITS